MPRLRENVTTNDLCRSYRFWGVLSLSTEIGKIRHSTVTLLLTTITEVLTDAHMYICIYVYMYICMHAYVCMFRLV